MEQTKKDNRLRNLAKRKTFYLEFADCKVIEKDKAEKGREQILMESKLL